MEKDYKKWHQKKEVINKVEPRPFFHEREIWFCYLGANVGFDQDGNGEDFLRPVLIIRKFNNEIFWGIPLTKSNKKTKKKSEKYYFSFCFTPNTKSVAILSQIRLIDARRLAYIAGEMDKKDFVELIKILKALLP